VWLGASETMKITHAMGEVFNSIDYDMRQNSQD
jgi:hypothetical protein